MIAIWPNDVNTLRKQSSLRVLRRFGWVRSPVFWEFARVSREIEGWTPAMIRLYTTPTPAHPHILICFWRIRPAGLLLDSERRDFAITSILVMAFAESSTCKRRPRGEMASYCSSQDYWCAPREFWGIDPREASWTPTRPIRIPEENEPRPIFLSKRNYTTLVSQKPNSYGTIER